MLTWLRLQVAEKHCFIFLLIPLIAMVSIDNGKAVINIYRVIICLPILLLARRRDLLSFIKHPFVKRYLLLTAFCALSLLWSEPSQVENMVIKILTLTVFLYLIYLVYVYQRQLFLKLDLVYIFLSLLLLSAYIFLHLGNAIPIDNVFGVFSNKNHISWFCAASALVVGYKIINEKFDFCLYGIFIILFSFIWVFESRAAIIAVFFGLSFSFLKHNQIWPKKLLSLTIILIPIAILFFFSNSTLIARGDSYRFEIYLNAFDLITSNITILLFGHGIASNSENMLDIGISIGHWHSIYISMLFYCGLIGLFLMCYCFFYRHFVFIRKLLLRKKATFCVWDAVAFGIAVALIFDGNRIYSYPSGIFISFLLPVFIANIQGDSESYNV